MTVKPASLIRCACFAIGLLVFALAGSGLALNLDRIKTNLLKGDYKSAILEGEKLLAGQREASQSEELYYLLGICYLKDGNYLRASDIFEIIIDEFKTSRFREQALMGLGDAYFFMADYAKALDRYNQVTSAKLKAAVLYRLAEVALKKGDTEKAKGYLESLRRDYPESPEAKLENGTLGSGNIFYTVQVGSFSNAANARNLVRRLSDKGYPAYLEELSRFDGRISYRVRVGKFSQRQEALDWEKRLSEEGYPTKIFP